MADELNYSVSLQFAKGSLALKREAVRQLADVAGDAYSANVQSIATTAGGTAVTIAAAVGTAGFAFFRNLDATNFVEVGVESGGTFYPLLKLKPGECALGRLTTTSVYARANTGAVLLETIVVED